VKEAISYFQNDHSQAIFGSIPSTDEARSALLGAFDTVLPELNTAHQLTGSFVNIPKDPNMDFTGDGDELDWRILYSTCTAQSDEQLRKLSGFSLDMSPCLIASRGALVDALVRGGTSEYLEFRTCESANVLMLDKAGLPKLFAVPCSKTDIFNDTTLTLAEKRVLMKFMLFVVDFTSEYGSEHARAQRLNETRLASGRALLRPQNKNTGAISIDGKEETPFVDFLAECGLSPRLVSIMTHAVALINSDQVGSQISSAAGAGAQEGSPQRVPTREGMARLALYVAAAGQFGSTSFITASYGMGDLVQAFVRLCAVGGGITLIAQKPTALLTAPVSHVMHSVAAGCGSAPSASGGPTQASLPAGAAAPPSPAAAPAGVDEERDTIAVITHQGVALRAKHVVASSRYLLPYTFEGAALIGPPAQVAVAGTPCTSTLHNRAMSIVKLPQQDVPDCLQGRRYIVRLPNQGQDAGGSRGASGVGGAAVHLLVLDDSAKVCPAGFVVIHAAIQSQVQHVAGATNGDISSGLRAAAAAGAAQADAAIRDLVLWQLGQRSTEPQEGSSQTSDPVVWAASWSRVEPAVNAASLPPHVTGVDNWKPVSRASGQGGDVDAGGPSPAWAVPSEHVFVHGEYHTVLAERVFHSVTGGALAFLPKAATNTAMPAASSSSMGAAVQDARDAGPVPSAAAAHAEETKPAAPVDLEDLDLDELANLDF